MCQISKEGPTWWTRPTVTVMGNGFPGFASTIVGLSSPESTGSRDMTAGGDCACDKQCGEGSRDPWLWIDL